MFTLQFKRLGCCLGNDTRSIILYERRFIPKKKTNRKSPSKRHLKRRRLSSQELHFLRLYRLLLASLQLFFHSLEIFFRFFHLLYLVGNPFLLCNFDFKLIRPLLHWGSDIRVVGLFAVLCNPISSCFWAFSVSRCRRAGHWSCNEIITVRNLPVLTIFFLHTSTFTRHGWWIGVY